MLATKLNMISKVHIGFVGSIVLVCIGVGSCTCDSILYVPPAGTIDSPKYPHPYDNNTNCMWHIRSRVPRATIVLSFVDLDIEADEPEVCGPLWPSFPCCKHNWLSVPVSGVGRVKTRQVCDRHIPTKNISVHASEVAIKLHISRIKEGGRGFSLSYDLLPPKCSIPGTVPCGPQADAGCYNNVTQRCDGKADCASGLDEALCPVCSLACARGSGCYTLAQKCDGKPDCYDFSDEVDCEVCEKGKALCSAGSHQCFHPLSERCNGRFECFWGEDEVGCVPGCEGKIACSSGEGCYSPSQRCDSLSDCLDLSDESLCPPELCALQHDKRPCRNGHCLPAALWCDGTDDCGDNSDEDSCLKNSIIALAIVGSLFCGLLLVVAVGCAFRIYGHRYSSPSNYHLHISPHLASRLRMSASVSLPTLVDDDFFHREPPPAYSVAVGESEVSLPIVAPSRPRRLRRQRLRPVPPPQVVIKPPDSPPCEASSSQSSPSRGSVTSSSYLSGTDDTLLLSS